MLAFGCCGRFSSGHRPFETVARSVSGSPPKCSPTLAWRVTSPELPSALGTSPHHSTAHPQDTRLEGARRSCMWKCRPNVHRGIHEVTRITVADGWAFGVGCRVGLGQARRQTDTTSGAVRIPASGVVSRFDRLGGGRPGAIAPANAANRTRVIS